ncbi:MAG TPA: trehalose-phosphatase [Gaiellaceae bacterium]|nr:trehalose-phosphatase [Gaiellaceae bacterium]
MEAAELLAPLARAPERSALVLDVDGTLAPIAPRPDLAAVPEETRAELTRLAGRYLLVACVSGRSGTDARRLVGVDGIEVVGNHGLELDPRAHELAGALAGFRDAVGLPVEDKTLSLTFHYREAEDEAAARAELKRVAERARDAGFDARWGRKVLEIRPHVEADKGTAVRALLGRSGARLGLYAGDDTTDLDGFGGLRGAGLEHAVCVAIASEEGPSGLQDAADLVVAGPEEMAALLRLL